MSNCVFERSFPGVYTVWFAKYLHEDTNVLNFLDFYQVNSHSGSE